MKNIYRSIFAIVATVVISVNVQATPIHQASSVTATTADFGGSFALVNMINQSGLSAGYTSGVTDFTSYTGSTTHNGLEGFSVGPDGQFSFDLGAALNIDGLALWASTNIGSLASFDLYADTDQIWGNGVGSLLGSFNALGGVGSDPAQIFSFAATSTQFLHIDILSTQGGIGFQPGIGEIAFRGASEVPEPISIALLGLGLAGIGFSRKR